MYWEAPAEWSDCSTDAVEAVVSSGKGRVTAKRIHDGFSRLAVESRRHDVCPARLVSVDATDEAHAAARGQRKCHCCSACLWICTHVVPGGSRAHRW
jgi:hypothetical protein